MPVGNGMTENIVLLFRIKIILSQSVMTSTLMMISLESLSISSKLSMVKILWKKTYSLLLMH